MNLLFHSSFLTGKRDSISFYFEPVRHGEFVKIHRVFYVNQEFEQLARGDYNKQEINARDSVNTLSLRDFYRSIQALSRLDNALSLPLPDELERAVCSFLDGVEGREPSREVHEQIDALNLAFFKYRYSLVNRRFALDETAPMVDSIINTVPFTEDRLDDFQEGDEPRIDAISPSELSRIEYRVYNVGQASCSALIKYTDSSNRDYRVIAVFDFGYRNPGKRNASLDEMISKIAPDTTIVISHFHRDHINNITRHCSTYTKRWVFPSCDTSKVKAYKLFQALVLVAKKKTRSGNIYIFPTPYCFSPNLKIVQNTGGIKDRYQKSEANAQSIVCELSIGRKTVLIPGDALYEDFATLNNGRPFDLVVVPHHGCLYSSRSVTPSVAAIRQMVGPETIGVVSCGKNPYKHANTTHLSWFREAILFQDGTAYDDYGSKIAWPSLEAGDYYSFRFV